MTSVVKEHLRKAKAWRHWNGCSCGPGAFKEVKGLEILECSPGAYKRDEDLEILELLARPWSL